MLLIFPQSQPIPNALPPKSPGNNSQPLLYLIVVIYQSSNYFYCFRHTVIKGKKRNLCFWNKRQKQLSEWYYRFIPREAATTGILHSTFFKAMEPHVWLLRGLSVF